MYKNNFLETPVGKFAFGKKLDNYYNNLSDLEALELYLEETKNSNFIPPHTFQILKDRNLVFPGEFRNDLIERYKRIIRSENND